MDIYLSQFFTGLSVGSVLLLIALGLTFTFGQMGVINLAHGELIMAGAYTAYMVGGVFGESVSLLVALPVAFALAGTMGLVLERVLIRRLYGRPLDTLLVTWGVSLVLQQVARDIFGAPNVNAQAPSWLGGGVVVAGGLGQLRGAVFAALGLGILQSLVEFKTQASLAKVICFVAVVALLQVRPQGLVSVRSRALT